MQAKRIAFFVLLLCNYGYKTVYEFKGGNFNDIVITIYELLFVYLFNNNN